MPHGIILSALGIESFQFELWIRNCLIWNTPISKQGPKPDGYNFITKQIYNWKKICLCHHEDLHIMFNLCVKNTKCLMPIIVKPLYSWPRTMTNGRIWMLGSRLMVVTIILGFNCLMRTIGVIVIIIIVAPFISKMFVPCKVVMLFGMNVLSQFVWWGTILQYPKCNHRCVVVHNYVHLQK